jgi:hypothetical protein
MSAAEAFHVAGEGLDQAALRAKVERNLAGREPLPFDPAPYLAPFEEPKAARGADQAEYALARLRQLLENPVPSDLMRPGRGRLDGLLDRARRPLHALVRYYVDTHAARQDEQLSWVLAALTALKSENEQLRAEVERLRAEAAGR